MIPHILLAVIEHHFFFRILLFLLLWVATEIDKQSFLLTFMQLHSIKQRNIQSSVYLVCSNKNKLSHCSHNATIAL